MPEASEILTATQVAALLQIHLRTVYKLARDGLIPGTKFGGSWRFSKDEILKMVTKNEAGLLSDPDLSPNKEKAG